MGAFANLSEYVNRKTGGNSGSPDYFLVSKEWRAGGAVLTASTVQGRWLSTWTMEGHPSHGAIPGAAAALDNTTVGGFRQAAPGGGRQKWLDSAVAYNGQNGSTLLYDRLLHAGGFDATLTTPQTVGGAISRNTGGVDNGIWYEIYSQLGATGVLATCSYTNQDGVAGRTTPAVPIGGSTSNMRDPGRSCMFPLQVGDYGVRSVESVTLSASTGTAGSFGIVLAHPLMMFGCASGTRGIIRSYLDSGVPEVSTSCLAMMVMAGITTVPESVGLFASMVER